MGQKRNCRSAATATAKESAGQRFMRHCNAIWLKSDRAMDYCFPAVMLLTVIAIVNGAW